MSSSKLYDSVRELESIIGGTPLLELRRLREPGMARVFVKLEYMNPTGSHKDRFVVYALKRMIEEGVVREGDIVVEASSGNTAVSLAWAATRLGLRAVIVVEEETSRQKVALLKALGAEVIKARQGENVKLARRIAEERGGVLLNQYNSDYNHEAHYRWTGPELYKQLDGRIDAFVMGMGTCGTVTGVGRYLKEVTGGRVLVVGVVPRGAAMAGGARERADRIEGLISSFVPGLFNKYRVYIDELVEVPGETAIEYMLRAARLEGIIGGPSTGANIYAALQVARRLGEGRVVATLAPDSVLRYTDLIA